MNVYMLYRAAGSDRFHNDYDSVSSYVVIAPDEAGARAQAFGSGCGPECPARYEDTEALHAEACVWRDANETNCDLVARDAIGDACVLVRVD